jgi:hypothetical protein
MHAQTLEANDFFGALGRKMYLPENADFCSHAVSFFGKLLDELAPLDCTDELFEQIVRKNEFVYGLLNVPRSTGSRCVDVGLSCGLFVAGLRFGAYGRQAIKDQSGTFSQAQQTECAHALRMLLYRRHAPLQKKKKIESPHYCHLVLHVEQRREGLRHEARAE